MKNLTNRLSAIAALLTAAGAFLLPFYGLGTRNVRNVGLPIKPVDAFLILAAIVSVGRIWKSRKRLLRSPLVIAATGIALATTAASVASPSALFEFNIVVRQILMVSSICVIATLQRPHVHTIAKGFVLGGLVSLVISLIGYVVVLIAINPLSEVNPFVYITSNPVFHKWPRLSGTFANSPQYMGQFLVMLLAVMVYIGPQKKSLPFLFPYPLAIGIAILGLFLTFTWAWAGGIALLCGTIIYKFNVDRPKVAIVLSAMILCVLGATYIMNIGFPTDITPEQARAGVHEEELDKWHVVNAETRSTPSIRYPLPKTWPYPRLETTYLHAKITSLRIISQHPIWGIGARHYGPLSEHYFEKQFGTNLGIYYQSAHCEPLHAWATAGIPGAVAYILFLIVVIRLVPSRDPTSQAMPTKGQSPSFALWLGVVGLLVMGLNVEIMWLRSTWILVGMLAASTIQRDQSPYQPLG